jgi:hypothetical protein
VQVGARELAERLLGVQAAVGEGRVLHHPDDRVLTEDVLRTVVVETEAGRRISRHRSTGPVEATRAMVWVVGELLKPPPARPVIHSRQAARTES